MSKRWITVDPVFFTDLLKSLPPSYAYHKMVFHNDGVAEDYIFLDAMTNGRVTENNQKRRGCQKD